MSLILLLFKLLFAFLWLSILYHDGVAFVITKTTVVVDHPRGFKTVCHLAGGGGFGSTNKKSTKKTKKKKKSILTSSLVETTTTEQKVKLDRFGLPVPTIDSIFPPMSPDTELIPSTTNQEDKTLQEIQMYMSQHISLNWDIFDSHGIEKTSNNNPWKLKLLHASPPVLEIENFFSPEECMEYMNMALQSDDDKDDGLMKVQSATFSPLAQSKRTSTTWYCHFQKVPTLLAKAQQLLLPSTTVEQMEEPQIVRYQMGQEFSWHYDEIPSNQLHNGGQRIGTLLVYLNTLQQNSGGGTIFRDLKDPQNNEMLTMKPKQGSALLFFPAYADGTPDDRTLHKGEKVYENESKMIAQMWIHQRSYQPILPEGNSHEKALPAIKAKRQELGYTTTSTEID